MSQSYLWINGPSRSGKTTRLVAEFQNWVQTKLGYDSSKNLLNYCPPEPAVLVLAANNDHRHKLAEQLSNAVQASYPMVCKTTLGLLKDEIMLFWPLLVESLEIKAQFPLLLRPETEQELATNLWRPQLDPEQLRESGGQNRLVRRLLDLLQLAGASCTPIEKIPEILKQGLDSALDPDLAGELLQQWRQWCLERGLLSYGLIYDLYWSELWSREHYRQSFSDRYEAVFADDLDDYPAIARELLEFCIDQEKFTVLTFNTLGQIRLGLNADPEYIQELQNRCQIELLCNHTQKLVIDSPEPLPEAWKCIQTNSRAELLRRVSEVIIEGVKKQGIKPAEIAIIAPGLDEIARYSLMAMLSHQGIPLEPLNEQRPLYSSPLVRALLTLLALVYPGLGRLLSTEAIAEMLVVATQNLDPVRAGILADYCYQVDVQNPRLLPVESFPRWDRIGAKGTQAYQRLTRWIQQQKTRVQTQQLTPVFFLDQAIGDFYTRSSSRKLNYEQLLVLRELIETAKHYWELDGRLELNRANTIADFIKLLRSGAITANPYPLPQSFGNQGKVTLATIFQYRSLRSYHRWQFWLDAGSVLWEKGGAAMLWGAPLFWRSRSSPIWTAEEELALDKQRLERILEDLQARVGERIYLCHSDLSVEGREQIGPLLSLVYRTQEI